MNRQPRLPLLATFGDAEIASIFSEESAIEAWLEVERELAWAEAELDVISPEAANAIALAARFDEVDRESLREMTRTVGYPILPLLEQLRAKSPDDVGAFIHWGATTQDIMDTALVLQLRRALARIEALTVTLGDRISMLASGHRATVMAGRTHAQQAVPTTFGAKCSVWLAECARHLDRLDVLRPRLLVVSLFGAAGTGAALGEASRAVRSALGQRLGLGVVDVPWHTARDSIAELGFGLASMAATCGKIGREVIELSRPEIGELREAAGHLRGASSTMPQKANPISSEVVVGMSILAAHQASSLLSAMVGGHERSAGEWQVEWDAVPTLTALAAGCLMNTVDIVDGLRVFPDRMRSNLLIDGGMLMAEAAMMGLGTLVGRVRAHDIVYAACVEARQSGRPLTEVLRETLDPGLLASLPPLEELLSASAYLGEVGQIVDAALDLWGVATRDRREDRRTRAREIDCEITDQTQSEATMRLVTYLTFNGQCAEAFRFYEQTLGGRLELQTHGESPMADQVPPAQRDRILHARLDVGDAVLMGSDQPPENPEKAQGFSVSITVDDPAGADRIFSALSEDGNVTMPIEESSWAIRFGMLVDRFGTPWMVNCDRPTTP